MSQFGTMSSPKPWSDPTILHSFDVRPQVETSPDGSHGVASHLARCPPDFRRLASTSCAAWLAAMRAARSGLRAAALPPGFVHSAPDRPERLARAAVDLEHSAVEG